MKAANYLTSGLRGIVAATFLSCAGPTLATRSYMYEASRKESAYLNMRDILIEGCCEGLGESYPHCGVMNFRIDENGFHCEQNVALDIGNIQRIVSNFQWDEIEQVTCEGRTVMIKGSYDSSKLYTHGPVWKDSLPQCHDLERAMRIYLEERKK